MSSGLHGPSISGSPARATAVLHVGVHTRDRPPVARTAGHRPNISDAMENALGEWLSNARAGKAANRLPNHQLHLPVSAEARREPIGNRQSANCSI